MFQNVKPIRISDQIATQIRHLLLEGKLKPGERLPTESELAEKFGASRASVREALSALESEGLVERRKNGGTVLRRFSLNRVLSDVEFPRKLDRELFFDLVEARELLEIQIVELATKRADQIDLNRIERALEIMQEDISMNRNGIESDILFHQCLAAATKNQVLTGLSRSIGHMMQKTRARTLAVPGRLNECLNEHQAIYEAVAEHNAELARRLIKAHLSQVRLIMDELDLEKGEP